MKSCGCFFDEKKKFGNPKHEKSNTRIYRIWSEMKTRCYLKTCNIYKNYGGRGITICKEWLDDFMNFYNWAMSNGYTDELTIDRIDVNGNYEPSNCRWATNEIQQNNKRNNRIIVLNGVSHTLSEWSKITGINGGTISKRIKSGWTIERALEQKTS